jgi:hypothetical protein
MSSEAELLVLDAQQLPAAAAAYSISRNVWVFLGESDNAWLAEADRIGRVW